MTQETKSYCVLPMRKRGRTSYASQAWACRAGLAKLSVSQMRPSSMQTMRVTDFAFYGRCGGPIAEAHRRDRPSPTEVLPPSKGVSCWIRPAAKCLIVGMELHLHLQGNPKPRPRRTRMFTPKSRSEIGFIV